MPPCVNSCWANLPLVRRRADECPEGRKLELHEDTL